MAEIGIMQSEEIEMPELPEVETVKNVLINWSKNLTITDVKIIYSKVLFDATPEEFIKAIKGQKIKDIDRKGKFLIFLLDSTVFLSHLRMEGKYFLISSLDELDKHAEVVFSLSNNKYLVYSDTRKFGKIYLKTYQNYLTTPPLNKLALDPFSMKSEELYSKLSKSNLTIKFALLDQTIIAGLGNIYVDEVCFKSQINPYRKASTISRKECQEIIENSKIILTKAIKLGGSTVSSFSFDNVAHGKFQNELEVYGRKGKKCNVCGEIIVKDKMKGRGTHYCPNCQKL